jgi:hypothetical protein
MLMSERITINVGSIPSANCWRASSPELAKLHHIGAIAHLAAKALTKEVGDIRLIINHEDADPHPNPPRCCGSRLAAWKADGELGE